MERPFWRSSGWNWKHLVAGHQLSKRWKVANNLFFLERQSNVLRRNEKRLLHKWCRTYQNKRCPSPPPSCATVPGEVKKCAVRVLWLMQTFALQLASPLLPHQRTDFSTATLADLCTCVEFAAADCWVLTRSTGFNNEHWTCCSTRRANPARGKKVWTLRLIVCVTSRSKT